MYIVADDMIVATDTEDDHDIALRSIMEMAQQNNSKFNKGKIKFECSELVFLDNVVSEAGLNLMKKKSKPSMECLHQSVRKMCSESWEC